MGDVTEESGFVRLSNAEVLAAVEDPSYPAMPPRDANAQAMNRISQLGGGGPRPSMETSFHALLGSHVLHTHSILANCFTCAIGGKALFEERWNEEFLWLPYLEPGWVLAKAIQDGLSAAARPANLIMLENHGPIVHGDSVDDVLGTYTKLITVATQVFGELPTDLETEVESTWQQREIAAQLAAAQIGMGVRPARYKWTQQLALEAPELFTFGNLIPDDAVYIGRAIHVWDPAREAPPLFHHKTVVFVPGIGVFLVANPAMANAMDENLVAHVVLQHLIWQKDSVRRLADAEADHLVTMDGEKYRQSLLNRPSLLQNPEATDS